MKMDKADFLRWFNRSFWKACTRSVFPIKILKTQADKTALVESVYNDVVSARYAPGIPEAELVMNKGFGVARTVPVFSIRDYCVYYFCIKELEDVLCGNRTPNTFGGWTLGGQLRGVKGQGYFPPPGPELYSTSSFSGGALLGVG